MKRIIFLTSLLTLSVFTFAQKKAILHYSFVQNIGGRLITSSLDQHYVNGRSIELPVIHKRLNDTTIYDGGKVVKNIYINGNAKRFPFVLKTPLSKSLIYAESIWIKPTVLVIDSLNNFKWRISKESKNIGDVNCVKAETFFRGRNYIAWFKPDQNIQAGPWKFGGLPGIIYEVADANGLFAYALNEVELVDDFAIELKVPEAYSNDQIIPHQDFINLWKETKLEVEKNNDKVTSTLNGSSSVKHAVAPLKELY